MKTTTPKPKSPARNAPKANPLRPFNGWMHCFSFAGNGKMLFLTNSIYTTRELAKKLAGAGRITRVCVTPLPAKPRKR